MPKRLLPWMALCACSPLLAAPTVPEARLQQLAADPYWIALGHYERGKLGGWRSYSDVLTAFSRLSKPLEYLYRELQFGLRAAVGTRTLDELLENKQSIDEAVSAHLAAKLEDSGLEVSGLGVRDIILPGEMKTLLAQVVEAEKAAQANVIRRREETSATRSLLNTAKVMEENPTALRLKELETLERVAERIDRISVFGGLDQVLNGLVTLKQA